jgi:hypothetical protein
LPAFIELQREALCIRHRNYLTEQRSHQFQEGIMLDELRRRKTQQSGGGQGANIESQLRPDFLEYHGCRCRLNANPTKRIGNANEPVTHVPIQFTHEGNASSPVLDMARTNHRGAVVTDTKEQALLADNRADTRAIAPPVLQ